MLQYQSSEIGCEALNKKYQGTLSSVRTYLINIWAPVSAPEKLCTRRRDICEFDVERYLKLNFANLLRMSVAWKLFQEHYHYFLRAEIRRRKVATNTRCWVFFNSFVRFWGSTFSGYSHFISEMVRTKTRAALKGRVDQYQVWTCLRPRICIPALKLFFLIGTNKFYNAAKYILQVVQMQLQLLNLYFSLKSCTKRLDSAVSGNLHPSYESCLNL